MKILKSSIAGIPDFAVAVAAHAFHLKEWRAHMRRVDSDAKDAKVPADQKHVPYPQPRSHALVESAVDENDDANFEIVDDGPTPEQVLAAKKTDLLAAVSRAEAQAVAAIIPPGRVRMSHIREHEIRVADAKIMADVPRPGFLGAAALAVGLSKPTDIAAEIEKRRPAEDTKFLAEQADRRARLARITRAAAHMQSDIEDLTLDNIDAWEMPPFPT